MEFIDIFWRLIPTFIFTWIIIIIIRKYDVIKLLGLLIRFIIYLLLFVYIKIKEYFSGILKRKL